MNYDTLEAGREMDALIAEKVMGRTICAHSRAGRATAQSGGIAMCGIQECKGELHYEFLPNYSTEIAAAWEVVEKLVERGDRPKLLMVYPAKTWAFVSYTIAYYADTAPLAICHAALNTVRTA